jgi:hypothetical protein
VGLRLKQFEKTYGSEHIKEIAKMECPVQILTRNMSAARDESSPSKIIMASKLLRCHTSVSEATTCRGCSKKSRCPFVQRVVVNNPAKTSLGALSKVLFGMSQSCRLHLKNPEVYPFVIAVSELQAGLKLTAQMEKFLAPIARERQLQNVPIADRKAVKAIVTRQLKKNQEMQAERDKARKLGLPTELMNDPVAQEQVVKTTKTPKFDINSSDWIPEESSDKLLENDSEKFPSKNPNLSLLDSPFSERFPQGRKRLVKKQEPTKELIDIRNGPSRSATQVAGGYVVGGPTSPGVEYIKPSLMKGKTVMDNVSLATKLWEHSSPYITELKFLKRVPFQSEIPKKSLEESMVDPALAQIVMSKPKESKPPRTKKTLAKVKVGLRDKKVEYDDFKNLEVVTAPVSSGSIFETDGTISGNTKALEFARMSKSASKLSETESHVQVKSGLRFPKLPQWDPSTIGRPVSKGTTEKVRIGNGYAERLKTDFSKYMRPKLEPTTPAEIAGIWNHRKQPS